MDSQDDKNYEEFFEQIKKFKAEQTKQKQRGLNDYNILTTVLKPHDEVRVHSRMIGSFLDINGKHYQDDLFLKEFLSYLKIDNYNTLNSKVYNEYENIDLYLTDGVKHIIIENKIWAGDQKNQIKRYIEIIKKENENLDCKDLYVIYLSIDRVEPSNYSLGDYKINNNYITNQKDEKLAIYKAMHYKTDILKWLEKCQYEVQNITNLNEAIRQYKSVVEMVINKYKGKVMSLEDELLKNKEWFKLAKEISQVYENANIKRKINYQLLFWQKLQKKLNNTGYSFVFVNGLNFDEIDINTYIDNYYKKSKNNKYFGLSYEVCDLGNDTQLSFYIEINWRIYYGFTFTKKKKRSNFAQDEQFKDISNKILNITKEQTDWTETNQNMKQDWWLCWKYPQKEFNFRNFNGAAIDELLNNKEETIDNMVDEIIRLIKLVKNVNDPI
jgi:hypothetical protein